MKFKDKVILLFLVAVLLYAVCCRNNILPFTNGCDAAKGKNVTTFTEDTLRQQVTEISHTLAGEEGIQTDI